MRLLTNIQTTGFPFHINGPFEVTSNRTGLIWNLEAQNEDQQKIEWNKVVIQDIILPLYLFYVPSRVSLSVTCVKIPGTAVSSAQYRCFG